MAEMARTAVTRARVAAVTCCDREERTPVMTKVGLRANSAGEPILLLASESAIAQRIASRPLVTVSVAAAPSFATLALTGAAQPGWKVGKSGSIACRVILRSLQFTGPTPAPVSLAQYQAAEPDPLWREAPLVLGHLEHEHMAELVSCVQAHGIHQAQWVLPRGLDRFGLELAVLTPDGAATVRLSFPDGPVTSLDEIPASLRAVLTCRCRASRPDPGKNVGT